MELRLLEQGTALDAFLHAMALILMNWFPILQSCELI